MAIDYASIGKRVKYYRTKANLSQEELGESIFAIFQTQNRAENRLPSYVGKQYYAAGRHYTVPYLFVAL